MNGRNDKFKDEIESPMDFGLVDKAYKESMERQALKPNDKMPFGKYAGQTFNEVGQFDAGYLDWFMTLESVNLSNELTEMIIEANYDSIWDKLTEMLIEANYDSIWDDNLSDDDFPF